MGGVRITGVTHSTVGPFVSVQIQLYFPMKWHGPQNAPRAEACSGSRAYDLIAGSSIFWAPRAAAIRPVATATIIVAGFGSDTDPVAIIAVISAPPARYDKIRTLLYDEAYPRIVGHWLTTSGKEGSQRATRRRNN